MDNFISEGTNHLRFSQVTLHIWGDSLDPFAITKALRIEPTRQSVKGQEMYTASGSRYAKKTGMWAWETSAETASIDLHVHLSHVLSKLENINFTLSDLPGVEDAYLGCIIGSNKPGVTEEFSIANDQINRLAVLGLSLKFAIII